MKIEEKKRERKNVILHYSLEWIGKGKKVGWMEFSTWTYHFFSLIKKRGKKRGVFRLRGIVFVVQGATFSSSHLSLVAWLVRHPVSGICDCPHENGFCWFVWCLCFLLETFRFLRSGHAQGLGNYPAAGIWLAQADGSLPCGGLIPPCSIVVLISTQVLPTDGANCKA